MIERPGPEVITIGETMVLVTPAVAECLETASVFHLDAGGAESNVASHLAYLGRRVAWVSQLGDDSLGRRIGRQLRERAVDTTWVRIHETAPTGVYFKDPGNGVQYFRAGSAASMMGLEALSDVPIEEATVVHLSGITPALSPTCAALVDHAVDRVSDSATLLSFDVNYRPGLWSSHRAAPALLAIAQRSDVVFVGLDEARLLWGAQTPAEVRELVHEPARLIVKDGGHGATEFDGSTPVFVPSIPSPIVEVVGAGDAFTAGYLDAHLAGADADSRLFAGHERAVRVLQSTNDFGTE